MQALSRIIVKTRRAVPRREGSSLLGNSRLVLAAARSMWRTRMSKTYPKMERRLTSLLAVSSAIQDSSLTLPTQAYLAATILQVASSMPTSN